MIPLTIGPEERVAAARVLTYAKDHIYRPFEPGFQGPVPGDVEEHVLVVPMGFRCVFTYTEDGDGLVWKHLSVSLVDRIPGRVPSPDAMMMLGRLFGFEGHIGEWLVDLDKERGIVIVAQAVPSPGGVN